MEQTTIELAQRRAGGIDVALFWNRATNELTVSVVDRISGNVFDLPAAPDQALDVFHHPYAYAADHTNRVTSAHTAGYKADATTP
jgi:hypothetical protein